MEIYDESGLSKTSSDTIVDEDNSQSSDRNSQNIPNGVTSNSDNTENNICESAYPLKTIVRYLK